jgi:uncharacterized cupredoxin-like copper-binding protein
MFGAGGNSRPFILAKVCQNGAGFSANSLQMFNIFRCDFSSRNCEYQLLVRQDALSPRSDERGPDSSNTHDRKDEAMKSISMGGLAVAATISLSLATAAFAATPIQTVHVALGGEAGQPMTIKLDVSSIKAGVVEFDVKNDAIGTDHEVVLVKLKNKDQKIEADAKTHRIDENKLKTMGEAAGLKPGDTGVLKVKLAAGDYVLLCNHKEHYELGMYRPFTVTK